MVRSVWQNTFFEKWATLLSKIVSPKRSSYSEEENNNYVGTIIIYPLYYTSVKLIYLKKTFGIKYATTNHIPGADNRNDPGMDYSSFTKAHWRSITRLVQEFFIISVKLCVRVILNHCSMISLDCYQNFPLWNSRCIWFIQWFKFLQNSFHHLYNNRHYVHHLHKILQWNNCRISIKITPAIMNQL